jgi:hypothetical protein
MSKDRSKVTPSGKLKCQRTSIKRGVKEQLREGEDEDSV